MQRKRRKKKRFGVFLFLLVVCIGIGIMFVPWAMQPVTPYRFASVSSMREQNVAENCWLLENIQIYIYTAS